MTSIIGNNQSNSVGLSQTEVIGAVKSVMIGGNFLTNVMGKMIEMITGNKESHIQKD